MNLCGWSGRYYVMKFFDEGEGEGERGTSEVAYTSLRSALLGKRCSFRSEKYEVQSSRSDLSLVLFDLWDAA
jgi:hypothetical protein